MTLWIKTTKVDGVYDKDPTRHSDAVKYDSLSYQEALASPTINVMDNAAIGVAMDEHKPVWLSATSSLTAISPVPQEVKQSVH